MGLMMIQWNWGCYSIFKQTKHEMATKREIKHNKTIVCLGNKKLKYEPRLGMSPVLDKTVSFLLL